MKTFGFQKKKKKKNRKQKGMFQFIAFIVLD